MKIAPLMEEMSRHPEIQAVLVHTGQHSATLREGLAGGKAGSRARGERRKLYHCLRPDVRQIGYASGACGGGFRSFDRSMPEEINRLLTHAIAEYLFTTEESANEHLLREGIPPEKIYFVGN